MLALKAIQRQIYGFIPLTFGLICADLQAQDITVSGFASLSAGRTNRSNEKLIDYGDNWSVRSDTVLGLQLNAQFNDRFSLMGQVVSRGFSYDDRDDFEPKVDWLTLNYQLGSTKQLRIGRIQNPLFLFSDTLEIGYSYVWVRPPIDVYIPILGFLHSVDGVDFSYTPHTELGDLAISFFAGETDGVYNNRITTTADPIIGFNVSLDTGDAIFRYGFQGFELTQRSPFGELGVAFSALAALDPVFQELSTSQELDDAWYQYHSLGAQAYYEDWTFIAEINGSVSPEEDMSIRFFGTYFSAILSGDVFTPYGVLGYSRLRPNNELTDFLNQSEAVIPSGIMPALDALRNFARSNYEAISMSSYSTTLGVRVDIHPQWALKAEIQYFTGGTHLVLGSQIDKNKDVILATIVVDTVF